MLFLKLLKRRLVYIIYNILLLVIAYFVGKLFPMLWFILFFEFIQGAFNYRFHSDTIFEDDPIKAVKWCKIITIIVEVLYLIYCKQADLVLYVNLPQIFFIAFANALLQFVVERAVVKLSMLKNEDRLRMLCKEARLTEEATYRLVLRFVFGKKIKEIAEFECVEIDTIKKSISRSLKKLNFKR